MEALLYNSSDTVYQSIMKTKHSNGFMRKYTRIHANWSEDIFYDHGIC